MSRCESVATSCTRAWIRSPCQPLRSVSKLSCEFPTSTTGLACRCRLRDAAQSRSQSNPRSSTDNRMPRNTITHRLLLRTVNDDVPVGIGLDQPIPHPRRVFVLDRIPQRMWTGRASRVTILQRSNRSIDRAITLRRRRGGRRADRSCQPSGRQCGEIGRGCTEFFDVAHRWRLREARGHVCRSESVSHANCRWAIGAVVGRVRRPVQ